MAGINVTSLVNAARDVQQPVSLAAVALLVLYLIFSQIVGKIEHVDQTVLPAIVNWIGLIASVAGELEVGPPSVTNPDTSTRSPR